MNGHSVNGRSVEDELSTQLNVALQRAIKAEKAYLSLKFETYVEKINNDITIAEKDFMAKLSLYSTIPEQRKRVQQEFHNKSVEFSALKERAKDVYNLCIEGLDYGLALDDLPQTTENPAIVKNEITSIIISKKKAASNGGIIDGVSGGSNNMREVANSHIVQNGEFGSAPVRRVEKPIEAPLTYTSPYKHAAQDSERTGTRPKAAAVMPAQRPNAPVGSYPQTVNYNSAIPQGYRYYGSQTAPSYLQQSRHIQQQVSSGHQQIQNSPLQQARASPSGLNMEHVSNYTGAPLYQDMNNGKATPPLNNGLSQTSPGSGTSQASPTTDVSRGMADLSLDNFIVDDEMFKSSQAKPKTESANHMNMGKSIADLDSLDDNIEEGEDRAASDDSDGSASDDEHFARTFSNLQGSKPRSSKPASLPKAPPPAAAVAETTKCKASPDESEEVNWKEEPFLSIVDMLSAKFKITRKVAKDALEAAARVAGGVNDLDVVYIEAEKSVKNALKPSPLQPTLSSQAAKAAGAKPEETGGRFSNYKTVLCNNYAANKKCINKEYCTFAHGESELRPLHPKAHSNPAPNSYYKVITCKYYNMPGGCKWEDNCIFAHGQDELRRPNTQAASAEADQGHNGLNHPEPCDNQQCPGKLEFLLKKTGLCERNRSGLCRYGKECKFAHSKKELLSMPKWEMCIKHEKKKCMHARSPDKCVYAHTKAELRKKPAGLDKHASGATGSGSGGRLIQPGRKYVPWAGDDKHPTTSADVEECQICMGPLYSYQKKKLLQCGHNDFHERCISQWVNEGMPSCPICRHPAKVPDLFKAPAGFKAEEFPGLGL